jgi:hypothetical protein
LQGTTGSFLYPTDFELQKGELDEAELNLAVDGIRNEGPNPRLLSNNAETSMGYNPYDRICLFLMG